MVKLMFDFIYKGSYADDSCDAHDPAFVNASMYILGDKYMVTGLQAVATSRFTSQIKACRDSSVFFELVPFIYDKTLESDLNLRAPFFEAATRMIPEFLKDNDFMNVITTNVDFGRDLIKDMNDGEASRYKCPGCKNSFKMRMSCDGTRYSCPFGNCLTADQHCWDMCKERLRHFKCPECETRWKIWVAGRGGNDDDDNDDDDEISLMKCPHGACQHTNSEHAFRLDRA